jgi:hypothetical protein
MTGLQIRAAGKGCSKSVRIAFAFGTVFLAKEEENHSFVLSQSKRTVFLDVYGDKRNLSAFHAGCILGHIRR